MSSQGVARAATTGSTTRDLTITVTLAYHHEINAVRSTASLRLLALLVRRSSTCSSYAGHVQRFGWGNQGV